MFQILANLSECFRVMFLSQWAADRWQSHEIFYPADEVLKARNIIFMTGSVLKKLALLVKTEHNMQNISDIIDYHVPVFTCSLFVMSTYSFNAWPVSPQVHSIFQSEFSRDCDLVLPNPSVFAFAWSVGLHHAARQFVLCGPRPRV